MQKRNRDRRRLWLAAALLGLCSLVAGAAALAVWQFNETTPTVRLRYGDLVQTLRASSQGAHLILQDVRISHSDVRGEIVSNDRVSVGAEKKTDVQKVPFQTVRTGFERDPELYGLLRGSVGAGYQGAEEDSAMRMLGNGMMTVLLFSLLGFGLVIMMRWMSGGSSPFTFGRSKARLHAQKDLEVTFRDVAGIDEAVAELREVVDFLKHARQVPGAGRPHPQGRAAGRPARHRQDAAGQGRGRRGRRAVLQPVRLRLRRDVRRRRRRARARPVRPGREPRRPASSSSTSSTPWARRAPARVVGGHDEREQTLNQLLVEMDGFDSNRGVIIMAATNRPETLDPALLRPGRFDRTVVVDRPDIVGREAILKVHVRNVRAGARRRPAPRGQPDAGLGRGRPGQPGQRGGPDGRPGQQGTRSPWPNSTRRSSAARSGLERKSRIMNADEKQRVAYHEAGHALVACSLPNTHPVHKISIIPRGVGALGYVLSRPDEDRYLVTQSELESRIKVALGGTMAEELVFREISNGATSDLEQASDIARRMVKQFGMSRLGRVCLPGQQRAGLPRRRRRRTARSAYSEQTAREIDVEVRKIIDDATEAVRSVLLRGAWRWRPSPCG